MNTDQERTFWNGEPCKATKVKVVVGEAPRPTWWCAHLAGQEIDAIRIDYPIGKKKQGEPFYILDTPEAWEKITVHLGSPVYGHKSVPVKNEVVR
ncbi:hypothetical protein Bb109J_c1972 [Bdellovibrio bacteriovorus]|uniref:hypothetical protein n=1 Tax=Bdellovibrio bacteriovorus TaxID=959 RepID=UPI00045BFADE|nr:hypothetical protein [Bdellovibrio bacteriovorus]AHZ84662.1 hypothetical protein EP01_06890 [Bdellovibrio bacteriovorus]BEV68552.1 hypothetical protein Bb109J_c1972 [Bdellovibrio bacteriovorus]